jgi:hypothetical protein
MHRTGLYALMLAACTAGMAWTGYLLYHPHLVNDATVTPCLIKHVTRLPCPSCGSSRAVLTLMQGDVIQSVYWNPFGLLIFSIMVASPLWITYDLVTKRNSFFTAYQNIERSLRVKWVAVSAIVLVLINWIWNISKGI